MIVVLWLTGALDIIGTLFIVVPLRRSLRQSQEDEDRSPQVHLVKLNLIKREAVCHSWCWAWSTVVSLQLQFIIILKLWLLHPARAHGSLHTQSPQSVAKGHANAILPPRFALQRNGVRVWRGVGAGECQLLPARSQGWRYLYGEGLQHRRVSALTLPTVMSSLNDGCYFLRRLLAEEWWSSHSPSLFSLHTDPTAAAVRGLHYILYLACICLHMWRVILFTTQSLVCCAACLNCPLFLCICTILLCFSCLGLLVFYTHYHKTS